uniref:Uncharacterized protein n=1 Tax=Cyclopterus lumpus TaxID=8103 RepID=A0A8C3AVZ8_CYCLU
MLLSPGVKSMASEEWKHWDDTQRCPSMEEFQAHGCFTWVLKHMAKDPIVKGSVVLKKE